MEQFSSRLMQFIESQHLSVRKFEANVGVSMGVFQKVIKNNTKTSQENIRKIFLKYPELNTEWLMSGTGNMLLPVKKEGVENTEFLKKELESKNEEIRALKDQIVKMLMEGHK